MSLPPHRCLQILAVAFLIAPLSVTQLSAQSESGESAQDSQHASSPSESPSQDASDPSASEPQDDQDEQAGGDSERSQQQAQRRQQQQAERDDSRSGLLELLRSRRERRRDGISENGDRGRERDRDGDRDRDRDRDRERERERERERDRDRDRMRDRDQRRDGETWRDRSTRRDRGRQRFEDGSARRGAQMQRPYRATPEGWVRIGADYDDDGYFESVETIYILDLDRATQRSRERRQQMREQRHRERRARVWDRGDSFRPDQAREHRRRRGADGRSGDRRSRRWRPRTVEGTLANLQPMRLAGMESPHLLAKMDTQRYGRIPVCLGPQEKLSTLDLNTGDHVRIEGVKTRINDRPVVFASRVSAGGESVAVGLPQRPGHRRIEAEIRGTRKADFRRFDEPFVIGRVETRGGRIELVNFGPRSKVEQLDLQPGDRVRLLVRPGRVNDQPALIAEEIHTGDQHVRVPRPQDRKKFRGEGRSRRDNRDDRSRRGGGDDRSRRDI